MKVNRKSYLLLVGLFAVLYMIISGCGDSIPTYKLEVIPSFRLNIPNVDLDKYFKQVTDVTVTKNGGFIIVDIAAPGVLLFDENYNYINNIAGYGSGNYETLCTAAQVDSLVAVHTINTLELLTARGKPVKRHFMRGRGDIAVTYDGRFLINRMYDSRVRGHCLETYDADGKPIKEFRSPRATEEGMELLDFGFSRLTPDSKIVYVPTVVDSAFIYDFDGNLLLAKKLKSSMKPYETEEGTPGSMVDDIAVSEEGIFIIRINKELTTDKIVFFDLIEQYDFELNRVAAYKLAKPITITTETTIVSPWYNNFAVKDGKFYMMVSQPFEQLIAFQPKK